MKPKYFFVPLYQRVNVCLRELYPFFGGSISFNHKVTNTLFKQNRNLFLYGRQKYIDLIFSLKAESPRK